MTTQHTAAVTVLLAAAVVPVANAVIINVPDDYPTIQQAILAALEGDEVVVAPGTYNELVFINGLTRRRVVSYRRTVRALPSEGCQS